MPLLRINAYHLAKCASSGYQCPCQSLFYRKNKSKKILFSLYEPKIKYYKKTVYRNSTPSSSYIPRHPPSFHLSHQFLQLATRTPKAKPRLLLSKARDGHKRACSTEDASAGLAVESPLEQGESCLAIHTDRVTAWLHPMCASTAIGQHPDVNPSKGISSVQCSPCTKNSDKRYKNVRTMLADIAT